MATMIHTGTATPSTFPLPKGCEERIREDDGRRARPELDDTGQHRHRGERHQVDGEFQPDAEQPVEESSQRRPEGDHDDERRPRRHAGGDQRRDDTRECGDRSDRQIESAADEHESHSEGDDPCD
ncbi:hypothetical protein GCM10027421_32120 [Microbacterium shaanxiense]